MKATRKRIISLLLIAAMVLCLFPITPVQATLIQSQPQVQVFTPNDYAVVDTLFDEISALEDALAKKNSTQTQLSDTVQALVLSSENYEEGSLSRNGDFFSWMTTEGIRCCYSPRMRRLHKEMITPEDPLADGKYNDPVAAKGGWPSGNQVYLIGPYYGHDSDFTNQYRYEAEAIAEAIGDTDGYTLYSGTAATVDAVAKAVSNGAVVIFDSHGTTDYEQGYDYVTGATNSYLCLTSTSGLTSADYDDGAIYSPSGIYINGATIANHMTSNSPGGLLWMAICLGMATNTICQPLRDKGVEVVYGYSQSVTFSGDYLFEVAFWDNMCAGGTVAESIAEMKSEWGNWDWSTQIASYYGYYDGYSTISAARADYSAFPIVVSDEDFHPGQRSGSSFYGADSLQTVKSTYTLFPQFDVTVQVNDSSYGSASISGNTITAVPAEGYFAQGYTVVSGTATITQNTNKFSVNAQSDCIVQINFAPKTSVTVNFSGAAADAQTGYAGDSMTLPNAEAPEGYTFLGWTSAPLNADTTDKPSYYISAFVPTENTTLYALYSYIEADSSAGTGDYIKVTAPRDDWSGEYVIVYENSNLVLNSSLTAPDAAGNGATVSIDGNTISADDADPYKFTIAPYEDGYSILGTSGVYIGCLSNTNSLSTGSNPMKNTLSLDAAGNANIIGSGGGYLRYNTSASRFRYYKSTTYTNQEAVALYLKDGTGGTVYYTSAPYTCEHNNAKTVAATAPTCTEDGYTEGVYCPDCLRYISGHEILNASGHNYTSQIIAPTATEQGYTIYTCSECSNSYTDDYTDALGETYTVTFVVPQGVASIEAMSCGKNGITLPAAGVPSGEQGYSFLGWVSETYEDTTEMPEILTGDFVAQQDTALYALYTYTTNGTGATEYILTDLSDIIPTDTVVITVNYNGTVYAMNNTNGTSSAPDGIIVDVATDNGISKLSADPTDDLKWNISGSTNAYTIYPAGTTDTWLYCNSANNGVRVGTVTTGNTFSISSGYLYNNGQARYLGVYRTNPDWRCYTSIHANISNQTLGFYVKGQAGTAYYTTITDTTCSHNYNAVVSSPSCTEPGYTTYTCNECGDQYTGNEVPAIGHSYAGGTCILCGGADPDYVAPAITAKNISLSFEDEILLNVYFVTAGLGEVADYGLLTFSEQVSNPSHLNAISDTPGFYTSGNYLGVTTPGIPAKKLGDKLYFAVYAKLSDGSYIYSKTYYYSPSAYAYSMLSKSDTTQEMKNLIVAMLNYGAAAQAYFNYNLENPINASLTTEQKAYVAEYSDDMLDSLTYCDASKKGELFANGNTAFTNRTPSVNFEGAFSVNFYFGSPKAEVGSEVIFYVWDQATYEAVDTLLPDNAIAKSTCTSDGTFYAAVVEGIAAKDVDETFYCAAIFSGTDGKTYVSGVIAYSLGYYLENQANGTAMPDFAKTTAVYAYYAKALFHN